MSTKPLLEGVGSKANILFLCAGSCGSDRGPVDKALHGALAWALGGDILVCLGSCMLVGGQVFPGLKT